MKTYGKWEVIGIDVRRKVTTDTYPLGFHRHTETWERCGGQGDPARMCRVLNHEPEPTVTLRDRRWIDGPYVFSTEALKAELQRRKREGK